MNNSHMCKVYKKIGVRFVERYIEEQA